MKWSDFFYLHKSDRRVLSAFMLVAVLSISVLFLIDSQTAEDSVQADSLQQGNVGKREKKSYFRVEGEGSGQQSELFVFDPNTADSTQLLRLGLHFQQVRNIYKYRAAGGIFQTKEDFAQLYGLTLKEYRRLEPYITISTDYQPASRYVKPKKPQYDTLLYTPKIKEGEFVDLATADTSELKRVPGIGSYYAYEIVKYRSRLGGFAQVDQLDEIDHFPIESKKYFRISSQPALKLDLNKLSLNDLKRHPYLNYYQARAIVEYRRLRGPLKSLNDLRLMPDFPQEAIERLSPYVQF